MWPAPEPVVLTVIAGSSHVEVPVRSAAPVAEAPIWLGPEGAAPVAMVELYSGFHRRERHVDPVTGETRLDIVDDFGEQELLPHGLAVRSVGRESYRIAPDDPLSAVAETHWTEAARRGSWDVRTETYARLKATATHWQVWAKIEAFEGGEQVFTKVFERDIERRLQ
jgi:hypothetical protein